MTEEKIRAVGQRISLPEEARARILAGIDAGGGAVRRRGGSVKKYVLIAAAVVLLGVLAVGIVYADEVFEHFNTASWIDKNRTNIVPKEEALPYIRSLFHGEEVEEVSFDEVVERIGKPYSIKAELTDYDYLYERLSDKIKNLGPEEVNRRLKNRIEVQWATDQGHIIKLVFDSDWISQEKLESNYYQMDEEGNITTSPYGGNYLLSRFFLTDESESYYLEVSNNCIFIFEDYALGGRWEVIDNGRSGILNNPDKRDFLNNMVRQYCNFIVTSGPEVLQYTVYGIKYEDWVYSEYHYNGSTLKAAWDNFQRFYKEVEEKGAGALDDLDYMFTTDLNVLIYD